MSEHTKGPWSVHVAASTRNGFDVQTADGKKLVAYDLKSKANAHLIAAAPQLFEACLAARLHGNQGTTLDGRSVDSLLRSAIAAASPDPATTN